VPAEIIEVTALRHQRRRYADITWHESYHLTELDVTQIDGIPVTRPVRTFLDLAVVLSAPALERIGRDYRLPTSRSRRWANFARASARRSGRCAGGNSPSYG
jgi:hypothetical protein